MTIDYVKLATEIGGNMTDGQEINRLKLENISLKNHISELEAINKHHQKLNGELQEKLSKYEDKATHYRRKGVL